jgi:hypothetical protein
MPDSPVAGFNDAIGSESEPRPMPTGGMWCGRLSQIGQTDWFTFPVRGNRIFTVVTEALDETGAPSNSKAMPTIGVWDAFDSAGATPVGAAPGLNGLATGETWLRVATNADDIVRIGIADLRGDGRPDYAYDGWLLYADTVSPAHLPASGGPITINGSGFRLADTVLVGGQPALVTSISPNQITAIAPPAASGVTGSVDVEVDDLPTLYAAAVIPGGISYDSGTGDALTLVTAPSNIVPIGVPIPFTVTALVRRAHSHWRRHRRLHRHRRHRQARLRTARLFGDHHRRWPRHHERHRDRWHVVHRHRLAYQWLKRRGAIRRRISARGFLSHAAACARRRSHSYLDRAGSRPFERHAPRRPVGRMANSVWVAASRLKVPIAAITNSAGIATETRSPLARLPRARSSASTPVSMGPVNVSPFPPMARARSTLCSSPSPERQPDPRRLGNAQPDRAPPPRHGRQPHGRRHGRALSGALRLVAALLAAHRSAPRARFWPRNPPRPRRPLTARSRFFPSRCPESPPISSASQLRATRPQVNIAIEQHP